MTFLFAGPSARPHDKHEVYPERGALRRDIPERSIRNVRVGNTMVRGFGSPIASRPSRARDGNAALIDVAMFTLITRGHAGRWAPRVETGSGSALGCGEEVDR